MMSRVFWVVVRVLLSGCWVFWVVAFLFKQSSPQVPVTFCSKLVSNLCFFQIFESSESAGQLELNILSSGHLLVSQGQELMVRLYENTQDLSSGQ